MNRNIEEPLSLIDEERTDAKPYVASAHEGVRRWFRRPYLDQAERDESLRLEERLRERARIARELHDSLFQGFLGVSLQFHDAVEQLPDDSPGKPSLSRVLCLMRRVIDEGRDVLQGLRSSAVASMNLEHSLSLLRDEFMPGGNVQFRIFVKGQPSALKPAIQEQVYLIGREALVNALRHSQATSIEAEVEYFRRRLRVVVRDNGCGIDPQVVRSGRHTHWGLQGMRERAGSIGARLTIWSRLGSGTEVEICVPRCLVADAHA
jgi:signal transduction histidine kinase